MILHAPIIYIGFECCICACETFSCCCYLFRKSEFIPLIPCCFQSFSISHFNFIFFDGINFYSVAQWATLFYPFYIPFVLFRPSRACLNMYLPQIQASFRKFGKAENREWQVKENVNLLSSFNALLGIISKEKSEMFERETKGKI